MMVGAANPLAPFEPASRQYEDLMKRSAIFALAVSACTLPTSAALAADWPTKPVRMVVPFAAGGAADVVSRLVADALGTAFGQQFVVENRAGGGGIVAAQFVARSDPDGYNLMQIGMSSHVVAPAISKSPGFDPVRDFSPIAFIGGAPTVILVHPSLGVRAFKELIALARGRSEGIEYVSAGTGTSGHMVAEFIAAKEKLRVVHVPYKAGSGAVVDLLAGRVKVGSLNWATAREHIAVGSLIPLAVSSAQRLTTAPELPTLVELGYPDIISTTWQALAGPLGLAPEIVTRLNRETNRLIERPDVRKNFENEGFESKPMTPSELAGFVQSQISQWAPVIKSTMKME
jgi:tripartite-type tricarboxylate transporter receptor subunit TctC